MKRIASQNWRVRLNNPTLFIFCLKIVGDKGDIAEKSITYYFSDGNFVSIKFVNFYPDGLTNIGFSHNINLII